MLKVMTPWNKKWNSRGSWDHWVNRWCLFDIHKNVACGYYMGSVLRLGGEKELGWYRVRGNNTQYLSFVSEQDIRYLIDSFFRKKGYYLL